MLKKFCEELYVQYMEELRAAWFSEQDGRKRLAACLAVIRRHLVLLKEYAAAYDFKDKSEEIWLFKYGKPMFYQWQVYYLGRYAVDAKRPARTKRSILKYYAACLDYYNRFFGLHDFHYQYFRLDASQMDDLYFIRGAEIQQILVPEVPEVDPAFSTGMEYLFSKFMAYEALKEYVVSAMNQQKQRPALSSTTVDQQGNLRKGFRWTGEIINLIEIGHGIYLNGQVNEGEIGINEFFEGLGEFFGVKLGVPKSGFDDLMGRKRLSKTHFTDRMKTALLKKMDDENGLSSHNGNYKKPR